MAKDTPQDSAGPSSPPPPLPEGWLAQWEGVSRKWYFVQRATGKSQWEIPTEPVALSPSTTPGSIGVGPTQAPGMTSSPISPIGMVNYGANRSFFGPSTEKAGLSSILGSHGGSGLSQLADRMLNKISKEFMPIKTGASPYQQFPPGHPNHPGSQMQYGPVGGPQYQSAANPYGYASTGYSGNYMGDVPQYHPQGQAFAPVDAYHQHQGVPHPATIPPGYPQQHSPNQPAIPHQFSPASPGSQSWHSPQQYSPVYSPSHQSPGTPGGPGGVGQPPPQLQWQMGPQPTIPHSTKPPMGHLPQQNIGNNSPNNHGQAQFHNIPANYHELEVPPQPEVSSLYSQGVPIYEAPSDLPPKAGHGTPGSVQSPQQATGPQQGNLSHHPSLASLSSHHTATSQPMNNNAFIAELPDNQVGMGQAGGPQKTQQPPNVGTAELPGSGPVRNTPTDPQFVSGPWTSPPTGANQHPPQNRYDNGSGFSR
ncbi:hypothetical protein BGW36DRAFT_460280 [Talaromyces proteolyticus]|uniref:WW domain-containing protein n=1 Tax=Talaromyces proteolyticus TaxID=1131652 RepID=A0AAD4Q1A0_9EURO|nr:uncharacterized protein BGW36DRAFT_460280 [Talaromyces proteolyticus]KAH8698338.1 hypothetical protein BGW36DRAFT_460280 [Talaromyces proteolyticus]